MATAEIGLCWGSNTHLVYVLWTVLPTLMKTMLRWKYSAIAFWFATVNIMTFLLEKRKKLDTLSFTFQVFVCVRKRQRSLWSFLATLSCHYLKQHIPVFQSFSHSVHDLMAGLMSCSLHVEGHRIVLMNHEKGSHTTPCEVFNNQFDVIHQVHPPKVCSVNKPRYWMFH